LEPTGFGVHLVPPGLDPGHDLIQVFPAFGERLKNFWNIQTDHLPVKHQLEMRSSCSHCFTPAQSAESRAEVALLLAV